MTQATVPPSTPSDAHRLRERITFLEQELQEARASLAPPLPPSPPPIPEWLQGYPPLEGVDLDALTYLARQVNTQLEQTPLPEGPPADLPALLANALPFLRQRPLETVLCRVFTPSLAEHGYARPGLVVETCMGDVPFILDTLRMIFAEFGLRERICLFSLLEVRGEDGGWQKTDLPGARESFSHFELEPSGTPLDLPSFMLELHQRLQQCTWIEKDRRRILRRVLNLAGDLALSADDFPGQSQALHEVAAFLEWLREEHFIFMSYERFQLQESGSGISLLAEPGSRLGLRAHQSQPSLPPGLEGWLASPDFLYTGKIAAFSPIHRRSRLDVLLIRSLDEQGRPAQVTLIMGLFSRGALAQPGGSLPVLRGKLKAILAEPAVVAESHLHRGYELSFNAMPLELLFAAPVPQLRQYLQHLLAAGPRRDVEVFLHPLLEQQAAYLLLALPRERYAARLRERLEQWLETQVGTPVADWREAFGPQDTVLLHMHLAWEGLPPQIEEATLRRELRSLTRTWAERLREALLELRPNDGIVLWQRYVSIFPEEYRAATVPEEAALDVGRLVALEGGERLKLRLRPLEAGAYQLRMYESGLTPLSQTMPALACLGLEVLSEVSTQLSPPEGGARSLNVFRVQPPPGLLCPLEVREEALEQTLLALLEQRVEVDALNALTLLGELSWQRVDVLRAYIHYNRQIVSQFPLEFSKRVCLTHWPAARLLLDLFQARFDPALHLGEGETREDRTALIESAFLEDLRRVESAAEDRVLRHLFALIRATVRTSFFQPTAQALVFKLDPARLDHLEAPKPYREIFIHHPELEGVHLRAGRLARGGLRWSDRNDDYRREALLRMVAQTVQNAAIVPVGAEGGFVLKKRYQTRDAERRAADQAFQIFVAGLLSVTDNRRGERVEPPPDCVRWDEDDPYLVVAAARSTAHLADAANALAAQAGFWMGDAFASGGSRGYHHRSLGVAARGVWESVKRHFLELGLRADEEPLRVVGIGSMGGDVFGNGLLLSRHFRLLGAFDQQHIFVDPDPSPTISYNERLRLFNLKSSSWEDYRRTHISRGGGVFRRQDRAIPLSQQMQALLSLSADTITGDELVSRLLCLDVDLLWCAGVGTYVKASHERHAAVGDRSNDPVRVDANRVRAKVIAEGGLQALTMAARLEYASLGGRLNIDALDGSAGMDCADREVNLRLLLDGIGRRKKLSEDQRQARLAHMQEAVCAQVLHDTYRQNLMLSLDARRCRERPGLFGRLVAWLEEQGGLDRRREGVPSLEELLERRATGKGLLRPELAKLMAYTRRLVVNRLLESPHFAGPRVEGALRAYFPAEVAEGLEESLLPHPLRREVAATWVANRVIDAAGCTIFYRVWEEANYDITSIAFSYLLVAELLDVEALREQLRRLEGHVPTNAIYQAWILIEDLLLRLARRLIRRGVDIYHPGPVLERLRLDFMVLRRELPKVLPAAVQQPCLQRAQSLMAEGMPNDLAHTFAYFPELASGTEIVLLRNESGFDLKSCAWLYFQVGEALGLRQALAPLWQDGEDGRESWQKSACFLLRARLVDLQYRLSLRLTHHQPPEGGLQTLTMALEEFLSARRPRLLRVEAFEHRLRKAPTSQPLSPAVVLTSMLEDLLHD